MNIEEIDENLIISAEEPDPNAAIVEPAADAAAKAAKAKQDAGEAFKIELKEGYEPPKVDGISDTARHLMGKSRAMARKKLEESNKQTEAANSELEKYKQENELLKLNAADAKDAVVAPVRPDASQFDDGKDDPQYIAKLEEFREAEFDFKLGAAVDKKMEAIKPAAAPQAAPVADPDILTRETTYYEDAAGFNVPDFSEAEQTVIDVLSQGGLNLIVQGYDHPAEMIYYLGKNKDQLTRIRNEFDTGSQDVGIARGFKALANLEAGLKTTPRQQKSAAAAGASVAEPSTDEFADVLGKDFKDAEGVTFF
jgi:hypothetical protein